MEAENSAASGENAASAPEIRRFTLRQRMLLFVIATVGSLAIRAIGSTMRYAVSFEEGGPTSLDDRPLVISFWHDCILPATYITRNRCLRVLASDSFDGEWITRIVRKFGFTSVRGSTTRGGIKGLLGMKREVEQGWTVAFTIDGPRGPRHVAKPGPILLASATGVSMSTFYVAVEKAWVLRSWDRCLVPKPFSRVLMRMGKKISVPPDGDREQYLDQLQASLEAARVFAEENVARVGSAEFPLVKD
ncbi:MAG TPA: lysophospholipid acyltransferase family protein [Terriglobales bacterium]|nr:lysophospholipid acyltransferase family protein [Terriglobales bacterium]